MELGLDGKVALITGGSDGIGYASAWELANEGATVVICARGQEALDEAVNKISSETGGVISAIAWPMKPNNPMARVATIAII